MASRNPAKRDRRSWGQEPSRSLEVPYHHGSHAALLKDVDAGTAAVGGVSAVLVPTCRPVRYLRAATRLARELDCLLVALCSKSSSAAEAAALGTEQGADVLAIDTDRLTPPMPRLVTTGPPKDPRFTRDSDLSLKRNLGLLLARVTGWERVLFLDDDIHGVSGHDVRAAAGLLEAYGVVGLRNDARHGFPDNSAVCHAYRAVGGEQGTFIGAGAVAVAPATADSFFPDIYNEDWLFFHDTVPAAATGNVIHGAYDPFADPDRARAEEFGDCLAEGLYWLLDDGKDAKDASDDFWQFFLEHRRTFVRHVLDRLRIWSGERLQRDRMIASVTAAQQSNSFVTPGLCRAYVSDWRRDVDRWRAHVGMLPAGLSVDKALWELRLVDRCSRSRRQS